LYIFDTVESDGKKENKRVGAAFARKKGTDAGKCVSWRKAASAGPQRKEGTFACGFTRQVF
jgi:hypothetical protein